MKIDPELCIACEACIPYCPMGAISMGDDVAAMAMERYYRKFIGPMYAARP